MSVPAQFDAFGGGEENTSGFGSYFAALGWSGSTAYASFGIANAGNPSRPHFYAGTGASNSSASIIWLPPSGFSSATVCHGMSVVLTDPNASIELLNNAGTAQLTISGNGNGALEVYSGGTLLGATPNHVFLAGAEFWLDIEANISATAGSVALYANGQLSQPVFSVSGVNTAAAPASLPVTSVKYYSANSGGGIYVRDGYIHDGTGAAPFNAPLGPGSCIYMTLDALVSSSGFTANGQSTLLANANMAPPVPLTDFNSANTVGNAMTFSLTALPSNVIEVLAVRPFDYSYKTDTGTRALQKTLAFGANNVAGTNNYLAQGPVAYIDPWITADPATGVLFAAEGATGIAAVNGAELTIAVTA